jgi:DNA polymerase-3 subunit alpha
MVTSFAPLRLRSRYSLFRGTLPAESLAAWLEERGFPAGALLDTGNLCGALEFYEACRARGVKPLIGADVACPVTGERFGVIALDRQGYGDLCAIVTAAGVEPETLLVDALCRASGGLAVLSRSVDSALRVRDSLGHGRVWLEVVANDGEPGTARTLVAAARSRGIPAVASWDSLCRDRSEYAVARVLRAIGEGKTVSEVTLAPREPSLESALGIERVFATEPRLLAESVRIAEMVDLDLELGKAHFPRLAASPQESQARLEAICRDALARKYPERRDQARARLAEELRVVGDLGMADYFLVVAEIVGFAAAERIPVAGRGSGAGSLVAYLLGITQSDPVAEDLLFERFLNELRPDYPDLDIDVAWRRRDEVIQYACKRFGAANAAMISTRAGFELRLAAREVAKAIGLSPYEAQSLADRLPYHRCEDPSSTIAKALGTTKPELAPGERRVIGDLAQALIGFPNHTSVHCGGIVVSDRPITYYTPLEMAAKGIQVTQFDMRAIERIGLIKIDVLGNRALSTIEEAHRAIAERHGAEPVVPTEDAPTASLLSRARTLGCFQLESPAVRGLLGMMRASTRADATLALALVRPGPSAGGMKQEFLRRRARSAGAGSALTCGLPVYEEDVMRIIAGWTGVGLAEADMLRRALKDGGAAEAVRDKFVFLARSAGRSRGEAEGAWEDVKRFSRYTFCKAHAASFGGLAYAMAYLKANYPLEFYAAALRNHSGMYPLWVHVNEARRVGVRVLPPSINSSEADFSIQGDAIRTGLGSIGHLAHSTIKAILTSRRTGPFLSLADFTARVRAGREEVLALTAGGALDEITPDRSAAMTAFLAARGRPAVPGSLSLGFPETAYGLPSRAFSDLAMRRMEYATLGFSPLVHPLAFFDGGGGDPGTQQPPLGRGRAGSPLTHSLRGLLAAMRHYRDKGPGLWFLSLDSPDGIHEGTVPEEALGVRLEIGHGYVCEGRVQYRFGVPSLRARSIRVLTEKPAL